MTQINSFISFCEDSLDCPYILGADGPEEYDCSGLPFTAAKTALNQDIPRQSTDQFELGISIEKENLIAGDFVFFDTGWTARKPNHLGIFIGDNQFINANSYNGKVVKDDLLSEYWEGVWYGAKRVFNSDGSFCAQIGPDASIFQDVSLNHPEYEFIKILYEKGIISGDDTTGSFRPEDPLNRAECVKIILENFNIALSKNMNTDFSDLENNAWYVPYIVTAFEKNIIQGYGNGIFKPANNVTRAEAVKIIFTTKGETINDIPGADWYVKYTQIAESRGMLLPVNGSINPHTPITRAEICRAICKS